jgi:hypothetical protein
VNSNQESIPRINHIVVLIKRGTIPHSLDLDEEDVALDPISMRLAATYHKMCIPTTLLRKRVKNHWNTNSRHLAKFMETTNA